MPNFRIGAVREEQVLVAHENAINFLGAEAARVLSTPNMVGYMERACRNLVLDMVDPGDDTVGTHVDVSHCAAAPMGCEVVFRAELLAVNGRRIEFKVAAHRLGGNAVLIGEGTHQRTVINVERFTAKVKA